MIKNTIKHELPDTQCQIASLWQKIYVSSQEETHLLLLQQPNKSLFV